MTVVVTGRSVLSVLYAENGEAALDSLPGKLGAEESAVARVIQSLAAARLISEEATDGTGRRILLTDAGRRWCNSELTARSAAASEVPAPSAGTASRPGLAPVVRTPLPSPVHRGPADNDIRIKAPVRHGDRMRGVHVVRVKQRQRVNPLDAASFDLPPEPTAVPEKPQLPAAPAAAAPKPPAPPAPSVAAQPMSFRPPSPPAVAAPPPVTEPPRPAAPPVTEPPTEPTEPQGSAVPESRPQPGSKPKSKRGPRYTIDDDGFITHIDGKKIC